MGSCPDTDIDPNLPYLVHAEFLFFNQIFFSFEYSKIS